MTDNKNLKVLELSREREGALWSNATFVFDTSALLELYNLSPSAQSELFSKVLTPIKGRLWIPHQVHFEFLKNRSKTIKKPIKEKYDPIKEHLKKMSSSLSIFEEQLVQIRNKTKDKKSHPFFDKEHNEITVPLEELKKSLNEFDSQIKDEIERRGKDIMQIEKADNIMASIHEHFVVGPPYSYSDLYAIVKEGKFRYENKIPPGYEDESEKIGFQVYGDLFSWKQILEFAQTTKSSIILVTEDTKTDWCYIEEDSSKRRIERPREELILEIWDLAKVDFWMYTLNQFLYGIEKYRSLKLDETVKIEFEKLVSFSQDKTYVIKNRQGGKVLDVAGGIALPGPPVIVWDYHQGPNQLWKFKSVSSDTYIIQSFADGRCLQVNPTDQNDGVEIQIGEYTSSTIQHWKIIANSNGSFHFISAANNKCIDANRGQLSENGGTVIQWSYVSNKNQNWDLIEVF